MKVDVESLIDRIKRSLGAPIVTPNITDNQIIQSIDGAIKLYTEFHYNGSHKDYLIIRVNEDSHDGTTGFFQLNSNVLAVTKILKKGRGFDMKGVMTTDGSTDMWFTSLFQGAMNGFGNGSCSTLGMSGMSGLTGMLPMFTIMDMNIGLWQKKLNPDYDFTFDSNSKILMISDSGLKRGSIIVCEAYVSSTVGMYEGGVGAQRIGSAVPTSVTNSLPHLHDYDRTSSTFRNPISARPQTVGDSFKQGGLDERWVIEYATASAKYQWGMNLTYVSGISQSGGGFKIDGQILKEEAQVEMNRLKDEVRKMGDQPIMMIG